MLTARLVGRAALATVSVPARPDPSRGLGRAVTGAATNPPDAWGWPGVVLPAGRDMAPMTRDGSDGEACPDWVFVVDARGL
jgi:hypothetical protein